jgi:hypothetical protein
MTPCTFEKSAEDHGYFVNLTAWSGFMYAGNNRIKLILS